MCKASGNRRSSWVTLSLRIVTFALTPPPAVGRGSHRRPQQHWLKSGSHDCNRPTQYLSLSSGFGAARTKRAKRKKERSSSKGADHVKACRVSWKSWRKSGMLLVVNWMSSDGVGRRTSPTIPWLLQPPIDGHISNYTGFQLEANSNWAHVHPYFARMAGLSALKEQYGGLRNTYQGHNISRIVIGVVVTLWTALMYSSWQCELMALESRFRPVFQQNLRTVNLTEVQFCFQAWTSDWTYVVFIWQHPMTVFISKNWRCLCRSRS